MRNFFVLSTLVFNLLCGNTLQAQDFSNKGRDFWVGYGYHQQMTNGGGGGTQDMVLYFATEGITTVTVTIPGTGYSQTYSNIPANTVFTSNPIPKTGTQDARLTDESTSPENKGIHITSDRPIVAYAHIYNQSVSGACILFPTNILGKEYYSINYKNISNSPNANCWFYVVATDTGTTTVEITPSANTINHPAGVPFTVDLRQGEIYNLLGEITSAVNPYSSVDLTGSKVQSISTGTSSCKKIGVFSGSGRISITCTGTSSSSDNYMVQSFPKSAWGKKYLTTPTAGVMNYNIYRVCVLDPTTAVKVNGSPIALPLQNGFYYEIPITKNPLLIEGDKPILVAQYVTSQGACGNGSQPGDPEVIYLSPVEQNINKVLWNATPNYAIVQHFFNVIIPKTGTAISSFRLDGVPVPAGSFVTHPQDAGYAYLNKTVSSGQHTISSDSGFNAIAYGFGNAESYGYNAGTNVKDLYQFVSVKNEFATVNFPAACRKSPFYLSMTFPYQPTMIQWVFGATLNGMGISDITKYSPVYDSTWVVNGKQLYQYRLTTTLSVPASGTYPIRIIAQNPTSDGCGGLQEINYDLEVFDAPVVDFSFINNGCVTTPVSFTSTTNTGGRTATSWNWNFGDGSSGSTPNPTHSFTGPGSYLVSYSVITDIGCISDTAKHTVDLNNLPIAKFQIISTTCTGKTVTFSDLSSITGTGTLAKWYWDFGDGSPVVTATTNANQSHIYTSTGVFNASLRLESASGCQSTVYSLPVDVHVNPVAAFTSSNVCMPSGLANFTNGSTIGDGTTASLNYSWNFGDGGTSISANPTHTFTAAGGYDVSLTAISNNGCRDSIKSTTTIYAEPQAAFNVNAEACIGTDLNFVDQSTAPSATVTQWAWDFGDGTTSNIQNPAKTYLAQGTYTVKLSVTSSKGCQSVTKIATKAITVNPLPLADFIISGAACEESGLTFTDASLPNAGSITKWVWNFGDGTNATNLTKAPFTHAYSNSNTYNISLQVETDKGCKSVNITKSVNVQPSPDAGFISPEICVSDPTASFIDTSKNPNGSITSWEWNFGDIRATPGNANTSTSQNPSHHYTASGSYTATLIATGNSGCKDTVTQTFFVNGGVPVAGFTVQNSGSLCSNRAVTIVDGSSVDVGNLVKVEIYWDYDNDPTNKTIDDVPAAGKSYNHSYPEFGSPASINYTVRYVAYSGINCVNTITKSVTVLATPILEFNEVPAVCSDAPSFQVTQARIINALSGKGIYSGPGIVSPDGMFSPAEAGFGPHTLRYSYNADNSCSNFVERVMEVYPTPGVNAGPDKTVLEGGTVTLSPALNANFPVTYLWTPSSGLNDPTLAFPIASPTQDMTYTLTVTSDKGCKGSDQVSVKLLKSPVIPNIFSPNGDGVHDRWEINFLESYPGCTVEIFNRYGQLIFRSVGYNKPWDGMISGKQAPMGTYYYIVDPKNGRSKMSGYVDIIR